MANARIGSALPFAGQGANYWETIDTTGKQLTPADSGKTFMCSQNATADVLVNLPSISQAITGWNARFMLTTAGDYDFQIAGYGVALDGDSSAQADIMYVDRGAKFLRGSATHNLGSLADDAKESFDVTVSGADLGDFTVASCSVDIQELNVTSAVRAANTVEVRVENNTGGTLDIASATWAIAVWDGNSPSSDSARDLIRFTSTATVGSIIEIFCDGTNWWAYGIGPQEDVQGVG